MLHTRVQPATITHHVEAGWPWLKPWDVTTSQRHGTAPTGRVVATHWLRFQLSELGPGSEKASLCRAQSSAGSDMLFISCLTASVPSVDRCAAVTTTQSRLESCPPYSAVMRAGDPADSFCHLLLHPRNVPIRAGRSLVGTAPAPAVATPVPAPQLGCYRSQPSKLRATCRLRLLKKRTEKRL